MECLEECTGLRSQTPLQVTSDMPVEIVYDLFRKVGLRYLLVTRGM